MTEGRERMYKDFTMFQLLFNAVNIVIIISIKHSLRINLMSSWFLLKLIVILITLVLI